MADSASVAAPQKKHGRKAAAREQRKSMRSAAPTAIPAALRSALPAGSGEPLPTAVATRMSDRFGADFSRVRVHTGTPAHQAARSLGAKAFTVGDQIVFNDGHYRPDTDEGERLLAHELAHVVQQSRGGASLQPEHADAGLEHGADAAAAQIHAGAGVVRVAGASGVRVACELNPKDSTAKRRIIKAMAELQKLEGTVAESKNGGTSVSGADATRAFDAITLARSEARASKNPTLIGVADGLIDQFDAATRGTQAERPSTSFEQHPAASATPMTPQEANRTVTAQRGFSAGLGAGKLADARAELELLESAEKAAGDQNERVEFRKKIEALKRRIAISTPTLKSVEDLTRQKDVLDKQLTQTKKPAEKQRLQVQIASLKQQIDATKAANANPGARPALSALQGGRLGHSGATFVTIQIVGADGKTIATLQARNDPTRHAEVVILEQLEALPDKASLKGATMVVSGDQEVCKKCTPAVVEFAKKYKFKQAYGDTENAPQINSSGKLAGKDATAKTTVGKISDPAAVDKLEKAQQGAGQAGSDGKVQLKNKRLLIYGDPDHGTSAPPSTAKPKTPPQASAAKPVVPAQSIGNAGPAAANKVPPKLPPSVPAAKTGIKAAALAPLAATGTIATKPAPVKIPPLKPKLNPKIAFRATQRNVAQSKLSSGSKAGGIGAGIKGAAGAIALDLLTNMIKSYGAELEIERQTKKQIDALQPEFEKLLEQSPKQIHAIVNVTIMVTTKQNPHTLEEKSGYPMVTVKVSLATAGIAPSESNDHDEFGIGSLDMSYYKYSMLLLDVERELEKLENARQDSVLNEKIASLNAVQAGADKHSPTQNKQAPPPPPDMKKAGPPSLDFAEAAPPPSFLPGAPQPGPERDERRRTQGTLTVGNQILREGFDLTRKDASQAERAQFALKVEVYRRLTKQMIREFTDYKCVESLRTILAMFDERMGPLGSQLDIDSRAGD